MIDHSRSPRCFGACDTADARVDGHNPLCGDHIVIYLTHLEGGHVNCHFKAQRVQFAWLRHR